MPPYQYISLDENKADLAEVWSTELIQQSGMLPDGAVIVADGGFEGEIMLNRVVKMLTICQLTMKTLTCK